ncbi:hypothetical protein [Nitrospira sp. KM1]|uniref:hypothetical protein n=1 Tax=Nitrospira sp. KM1 TaxID=1936990 RepID=UPI0015657E4C|nr:hypothetical protein [Nitrospira sp. KM1]
MSYTHRMSGSDDLDRKRLVADFMRACAPLEAYIQQAGYLTKLEFESIQTTVDTFQLFLDSWQRKRRNKQV